MATSLSNETSTTSFIELSQNPLLSGIQAQDGSYGSSSNSFNAAARSDNNGFGSSVQGANGLTSGNQNSSTSAIKNRGDSISTSSSYQQQQSALIQSAGLAYPLFYPNSYLASFPQASASSQYNYSASGVGNGNMQASQSTTAAANSRRGGKKKTPTTQAQNPGLRLFFNLKRRDSQIQTNKGQSHVYKPKNPPSVSEWFKRLSVEERVNALSTICPHLTETFVNMHKRIEESGQSSFARTIPNTQDSKYFSTPSYLPTYQQSINSYYSQTSSDSSMSTFEDNFYSRTIGETEIHVMMQNEKEKYQAEQEIFKHVRLTDYFNPLDTLTVTEDFVQDADYFFKLMSYATSNQAFSSSCQFETKQSSSTAVIEQPNWFKPKSFHSFTTWIIVALEENLWAHYNYFILHNTAKVNELSPLFREKTDMGAQDVDLTQLSAFWRDTSEKDKKVLIDQFKAIIAKEVESEFNTNHPGSSKIHKVVHSKHVQYSLHIKEKPEKQTFQEQAELALQSLIDFSLRPGAEQELITTLMYSTFDRCSQRQVNIDRKFLDLIKKKFKDDLMENLLQEEYSTTKSTKQFKKKKKKNFNVTNQQSSQATTVTTPIDKGSLSSGETNVDSNETQPDETIKIRGKKKKGKQNIGGNLEKVNGNMSSQEQAQPAPLSRQSTHRKKKKNNGHNFRNAQSQQQTTAQQEPHSCDDQQKPINDDTVESDNKNSSLDTKSSSNMYDLATAHQSNNSNTNSSATIKSGDKEQICLSNKVKSHHKESILGVNSSKSLELNPSFIKEKVFAESPHKQQKPISKVESKNIQILQNSQNQEPSAPKSKTDDRRSKNTAGNQYSESCIAITEDDESQLRNKQAQQESRNDAQSMDVIRQYVRELTYSMINEVCRRLESESPLASIDEQGVQHSTKQNNSLTGQNSEQQHEEYPDYKQPNKSNNNQMKVFGKKQRKESNQYSQLHLKQNETVDENQKRKKSFNSKKYVKEDKKFTEDYADTTSQLLMQSNSVDTCDSQPDVQPINNNSNLITNSENGKSNNKSQRKGFGIHLKPSEKQEEPPKQNIKQGTTPQAWAKGTAKQAEPPVLPKKVVPNQKKQSVATEQDSTGPKMNDLKNQSIESSMLANSNKDDSQSNQQLNKRKRNKKKLNKLTDTDIMNNFMKTLHQQSEDLKESSQNNQGFKKKNLDTRHTQQRSYPKQAVDAASDIQHQSVKSEQLNFTEDQKPKSFKQKYSTKNTHSNLNFDVQSEKDTPVTMPKRDEDVSPQQATAQHEKEQQNTQSVYQVKKCQTTKSKNSSKHQPRIQQRHSEIIIDDKMSMASSKADCISDERSPQSQCDKPLYPEQQLSTRSAAFRHINFQTTANECENTSFTDLTGTTNTAVNTSLENNVSNPSFSKYQSYQNTPLKPVAHHPKNYQKQHTMQNFQQNDKDTSNYRTPPQLTKKSSTQTAYSHHGGNYRKNHHNTAQHSQSFVNHHQANQDNQYSSQTQSYNQHNNGLHKNSHRTQGQYRQTNRTQGHNNNVYVQQMNLSQSMQEQRQQYMQPYMTPQNSNIFYQDQSHLLNHNQQQQSADTYNKPQDGVFQYVEKNHMTLQQPVPLYSPNQYQVNHVNQYVPAQNNEMIPNPFNYQRIHAPYFDQSQDLIFQIFNSIKSNHSMSPIPQMISPPPLYDYQLSQSTDLSMQPLRHDSSIYSPHETMFHQVLDQEIESHIRSIEDSINQLKPERDYIFDKLSSIANTVFTGQHPKLVLFGSLITGLALESSDMDLAVTGLQIDDRFVMVSELGKLASALSEWDCLESFKSIETASIPVIKMKVDLVKLRDKEMREREDEDFTKRPIPDDQRYLSVDITFDDSPVSQHGEGQSMASSDILNPTSTKTHLGLQSCALVQHYIADYKTLKEVAILLKKFLAIHEFNSPYYAYMNYYGLRGNNDMTPSRLLMGFLDFYGNYFNPGSMGISVYEEGSSFFALNSLLDSNFVILDPLNLQNNTTRNSYHTKEILLKFQCAFNNLKSLMHKLPQQQQAVLSQQTVFSKANSQDQKSSIPFERASPQPSNCQSPHACNIQQTSNNQYLQNVQQERAVGSDYVPHGMVPEDNEATNLELGCFKDSQITLPPSYQVSLLETFFAKDAQLAADISGLSPSQIRPRGTQITMIEEAHTQ